MVGLTITASAIPLTIPLPARKTLTELAAKEGLSIDDYRNTSYITLGMDGEEEIEDSGNNYHVERREFSNEGRFFSASQFRHMTGEKVTVSKGQYLAVGDNDGNALYANDTATLVTNMTTKEQLKVKFGGVIKYGMLSGEMGYYVLSDEDYAKAAKGLAGQWIEGMTFFNIKSGDNYQFADSLYRGFIDSMDDKAPLQTYYDRVAKYGAEQRGEVYWGRHRRDDEAVV